MASVAGGSGDNGGSDRGRGNTEDPHGKFKLSPAFRKACLRYLEKKHEKCVAAGEEPPFGGRYASAPPNPAVETPSSSTTTAKKARKPNIEPKDV